MAYRFPLLRRSVLSALLILLLVMAGIVVAVRLLEPRFAFFPARGEDVTPSALGVPYGASVVTTEDGEQVRVWTLRHPRPRATVVYFHGNGGNLSVWAPILVGVQRQGYTVHAFDYRGYGQSTGTPSERGLYRDAAAVVQWVSTQLEPDVPVIYWGRSLGSAVAAFAARVRRPDGVIVEAGFTDVRSLLKGSPLSLLALFSSYRFPTAAFLREARAPVLVMHGDGDTVIPFSAGRALFERIGEPKRFFLIGAGDHNDLAPHDAVAYWRAVADFVAAVSTR
jgi:fermentation-respiration switch protein FrsA (DUF1100 family)